MASTLIAAVSFIVLGALIGWVTNRIAVKMLFHPREEKRILGFSIQGLLPSRQKELASTVGDIVERELIDLKEIRARLDEPATQRRLYDALESAVRQRLSGLVDGLNPMMRGFVTDAILEKICAQIVDGVWESVPDVTDKIFQSLEDRLRVKHLVREKIEAFNLERLEEIVHEIAAREFRHIEFLGALLGGLIGVGQFGLYLLLR